MSRPPAHSPASRRLIVCLLGVALLALFGCTATAHGADVPQTARYGAAAQPEQRAGTKEPAASEEPTGHLCTQPVLGQTGVAGGRAFTAGPPPAVCTSVLADRRPHLSMSEQGPRGPCTQLTGRSRLAIVCCWRI
ncbi:hypothetical protein ITI46_09230 [Streptomyces oryzae]|uniref:Lipoprotein n=1 Tax=Streptomyces oryzae TaxID=1434886 RepID=A0ABS3X9U0_9ACTN|nr:hypothetical protein [Streptomyces oryzae]MBO8191856.1 hypothetical protein [Streptomyces oryzae]